MANGTIIRSLDSLSKGLKTSPDDPETSFERGTRIMVTGALLGTVAIATVVGYAGFALTELSAL